MELNHHFLNVLVISLLCAPICSEEDDCPSPPRTPEALKFPSEFDLPSAEKAPLPAPYLRRSSRHQGIETASSFLCSSTDMSKYQKIWLMDPEDDDDIFPEKE
jgi:hypothetical protein